jgi:hypothetical protein
MRALSTRERKLVAIGLLMLAIAGIWWALIEPFADGFAERTARREELRLAYVRNSRLINAIPPLRRRAENQSDLKARFLLVDKLRERMRTDFASAGGEVTAVQDVPAQPGYARAWVQGRITLAQLQTLLGKINSASPALIIESLRISADKAIETGHLEPLDVRLETSVPTLSAAQ